MKIKVKLFIFLITFIFCGTLINQTRAQVIPLPSPPPPPPVPPVSISKNKQIEKFETVDYVFVLQIDINTRLANQARTSTVVDINSRKR